MIAAPPTPAPPVCPACRAATARAWANLPGLGLLYRCGECGLDFNPAHPDDTLDPAADHFSTIDLAQYAASVGATRRRAHASLLALAQKYAVPGNWLDVGCSYGWLLEHLQGSEFQGYGVEPSPSAAAQARAQGLRVEEGLFPAHAGGGAPYAVISFLDVLEHFAEPEAVLTAAHACLQERGVLLLQVPDQSCLLYWLGKAAFVGTCGRVSFALERLWLSGFHFPHRVYFNLAALRQLLTRTQFQVECVERVLIGSPLAAFSRVGYAGPKRRLRTAVVGAAVAGITSCDWLIRHGGLLRVVARRVSPA